MSKLWCIALAFDDRESGSLVLATRLAPSVDIAVAMAVSQFYTDNPGVRLPLQSIATMELTREFLEERLRAMDEAETKPPSVVQLVPITAGEHFKELYGRELDAPKDEPAA